MKGNQIVVWTLALTAGLSLPAAATVTYTEDVLGAWGHASITVSVQIQDLSTRTEVKNGITNWKNAINAFADSHLQYSNLRDLRFLVSEPNIEGECVASPSGQQLQLIAIPTIGDVCLIPPYRIGTIPDVLIADPSQQTGVAHVALGTTPSGAGTLWTFRTLGLELDNGEIQGPVLVIAATTGSNIDRYNVGIHEFGHAFGVGHVEVNANLQGDVMYVSYVVVGQPTRRCFSTLNLEGVREAYEWLGGPFQTPDTTVSIDSAAYAQSYCP